MERLDNALGDLLWELQDDALDSQLEWLDTLPVTKEVRREVFEHMCAVTGLLIDTVIALGRD